MTKQRQSPENLPIGGSNSPSIKIQAPKEGLEGLKELLSSIFSKGDKAARATLGPAAAPVEELLSLFDLRDIPAALSSAGKDLETGVTEGDSKAMLAGVLGTALVGAENIPGGRAVGKASKSIRDYPDTNLNQRLDFKKQIQFLEDHGYSLATDSKNKNFKYNIEDDKIIVYTPLGGTKVKDKYEQKTFKNPTLKQMRNWMGYKKGGSVVERNPYNYTAKAI